VAFTLCVTKRERIFTNPEVVQVFVHFLKEVSDKETFRAIYCFLPDHVHLILMGSSENSNVLRGVELFKQITGHWFHALYRRSLWQKSFYDRIIRARELGLTVRYVLDNPVRRGLVDSWREYPYIGAVGLHLETFLTELQPD